MILVSIRRQLENIQDTQYKAEEHGLSHRRKRCMREFR